MHVAYIHQHFATRKTATGTRSYEMSRRLLAAGHRVSMICGVNEATKDALKTDGRITRMEIDGIEVHCVAEDYSNSMGFTRRLRSFFGFMNEAGRIVRGLDADIVFASSTPLTVGVPGMRGARALKVPFVFEVRDLWPEVPVAIGVLKNPLLIMAARYLERKIYRASDHIVALSPGMKDGIVASGYPAERITLIPNSSDTDLFHPSDESLDDERFGPADDFRLVFTGAHGLANGLDSVLDAARVVRKRGIRGVRFVFIGQGGQRDRLIARSRDEGTDEIISWVPYVVKDELARVLPRMDVGMMILKNLPAFYFGTSPNKFFDYIASGLPVLNNYPGWVAGMIEENQCGRVVPPDDPEAFVDAVVALRDDPAGRAEMGRRSRALAEREFDRDLLAGQFVRTLEEAHRRGRG